MAFLSNEKKDSDVEMSEANQASPAQDAPALTQTFVEGFSSFQDKMERRRAEMESSVAGPSATSVPTSVAPTLGSDVALTRIPRFWLLDPTLLQSRSTIPASGSDVPLPAGEIVVPEQAPDVQARLRAPFRADSGFGGCGGSHASSSRKEEGDRLGTSRVQRCSTIEGTFKSWGCRISEEEKFVSLIDGMLGDCGLEVTRLSKELDSSRETLKRTEAVLQSIESTHAAQTSTLEARISDLERDLGKTVSSLLKAKEEKKSKSSEVRRLKRRIQRFEEMGACTATELPGPSSSGTLVRVRKFQRSRMLNSLRTRAVRRSARAMARLFLLRVSRRMKAVSGGRLG
ncbi:Uncharacterized protein Rs2_52323 [Raphanus sativus]|nr:Uncharacterized protein Rs2_52323 [Raphanus sativus]